MSEIWRDIPGYEGLFWVSATGRVYNRRTGRILRAFPSGSGYLKVMLCYDATRHAALVHRLVAAAFIPNPDQKPQVNHKNGIKTDNAVANLEWCTMSENLRHRHRVLNQRGGRSKPVVCSETGVEYPSAKEAAAALGLNRTGITQVCNGQQKTTKNLHFKHKEDI